MGFLQEPEPHRGIATPVIPGVRRIVAENPGAMTYHGTNTYIIDSEDGVVVLDPGPADAAHVRHILSATAGRVDAILLSHTHADHLGAAPALRDATGAPIHAYWKSAEPSFEPDVPLRDGDAAAGMVALHTPGHAADHLCFAAHDGVVFTADHVMSWSSSVVSPPKGDMAAYFASLRRLLARNDKLFLPGHGPALPNPRPFIEDLLSNRQAREEAIAAALEAGPLTTSELMAALYSKVDPILRRAAERNVAAHLLKLEAEGRAARSGETWSTKVGGARRAPLPADS